MEGKTISNGLRSSGLLGKKPIIGLLMFILGSLIFIILAHELVNQGPLIGWDLPIAESFHALALNSPPLVINIMIAGYDIGYWGIWIVGISLVLYFFYKRFWRELTMVSVGFLGGGVLFSILSNIFKRPRPFHLFVEQIWSGSPNIPGFPSGHTLGAVYCFGLLTYLLVPRIKPYLGKAFVVLIGVLVMLFIGFSRLYIGDHYLTDVIAGYAVGIAWFGLVYTSIELVFQLHYLRKEKNEQLIHKDRGINK